MTKMLTKENFKEQNNYKAKNQNSREAISMIK